MTAGLSAARRWLDRLDQAPADPYEHASWLALRQEAVTRLTSALTAVLDLADELDVGTLDQLDVPYYRGTVAGRRQYAADRIRAAVAAATGEATT